MSRPFTVVHKSVQRERHQHHHITGRSVAATTAACARVCLHGIMHDFRAISHRIPRNSIDVFDGATCTVYRVCTHIHSFEGTINHIKTRRAPTYIQGYKRGKSVDLRVTHRRYPHNSETRYLRRDIYLYLYLSTYVMIAHRAHEVYYMPSCDGIFRDHNGALAGSRQTGCPDDYGRRARGDLARAFCGALR